MDNWPKTEYEWECHWQHYKGELFEEMWYYDHATQEQRDQQKGEGYDWFCPKRKMKR